MPASAHSQELFALLDSLGLRHVLRAPGAFELPPAVEAAARGLAGPPASPTDRGERLLAALCFGQPASALTADGPRAEARRLLLAPSGDPAPLLWPRRPWGEIAEEVAARLAERGVLLRRRALAEAIEVDRGRVVGVGYVQRPDSHEEIRRGERGKRRRVDVDAVVATPCWPALAPLLPPDAASASDFRRAEALRPIASATVQLWYAEPWPGPFLQALDGPLAFALDASRLHGRAGELYQVTVVVDPDAAATNRTPGAWSSAAAATLERAVPPLKGRAVARAMALRDPAAAFESQDLRPSQRTSVRGLTLAGDWTATGLPPSIEGAVASGRRAAACLTEGEG